MTSTEPWHGLKGGRKESHNRQRKHWILLTALRSSSDLPQGWLCAWMQSTAQVWCPKALSQGSACQSASFQCCWVQDWLLELQLTFHISRKGVNSPSLLHIQNFKILPYALKSSTYLLRKNIMQDPIWQRSYQHYFKSLLITKQSRWQIKSWTLHLPCLMNSLIT